MRILAPISRVGYTTPAGKSGWILVAAVEEVLLMPPMIFCARLKRHWRLSFGHVDEDPMSLAFSVQLPNELAPGKFPSATSPVCPRPQSGHPRRR
jgi:hypothetical protein